MVKTYHKSPNFENRGKWGHQTTTTYWRSLKYPIDTLWFCPVFEQTMALIPSLRISLDSSDLCV